MKKIVLLVIFVCFNISIIQAADFPKIKGYKQTSEVREYGPGNLWEYINGAADQFLDYEFVSLRSCDLSAGGLSVSIDIYDMDTPLNAFGIYANERPLNRDRLSIGVEAVISPPYQALLLKDKYYIKIDVLEGEISEDNGKSLLTAIANVLVGIDNYPGDFSSLPETGIIKGSQRYSSLGFLGLKELNYCIYADYILTDKTKFQYFFINTISETAQNKVWNNLSSKWKSKSFKDNKILIKKVPYQGFVGVVLIRGRIYGVSGFDNEKKMIEKIAGLVENFN